MVTNRISHLSIIMLPLLMAPSDRRAAGAAAPGDTPAADAPGAVVPPAPVSAAPTVPALRVVFAMPENLSNDVIAENAKAGKGTTIAKFSLLGCFGSLPIAMTDGAVSRKVDKTIAVYMPAAGQRMQYKHISAAPRFILDTETGEHVPTTNDAGVLAVRKLERAIGLAWVTANEAGGQVYNREWPLGL